jgi:hypothetical protein
LAEFSQTSTSLWCTGQLSMPRLARRRTHHSREKDSGAAAKIHWNVRCAPDCPVSQRGPRQRSASQSSASVGHTGLSSVHRTLSGVPTGPKVQRSGAPDKEGDQAPDSYCLCLVVHRTVQCATRQKARIAFQLELQRLLAALGL